MPAEEMREPTFLILTSLAAGPLHGYAVLQEVSSLSGGRVRLRPGSLYGALDRLVGESLVEPAGEEVVEGRRRQYFRLTEQGRAALGRVADRLADQAAQARSRLRVRPGSSTSVVTS